MCSTTCLCSAQTPSPEKRYRIYMVLWSGEDPLSKGFMDYLRRRNIPVDYIIRNCDQDRKRCHGLVPEIRQLKPDLIFTWGTPVCEEIGGRIDDQNKQDYIWDIPIIALIVTDPIRSRVIYDLKRTGRNITGVNHVAPVSSHIEAMKTYMKSLKKIAALYNPTETNSKIMVEELITLGPKFHVDISLYPIHLDGAGKPIPESIPEIIKKIAQDGQQFIYMPADTFLSVNMKAVIETATQFRLLTFGSTESMFFSNSHPLMGVLSRFYDVGLLGGVKAEDILLKQVNPKEIPYQKLGNFSLLISPDVFRDIKIYPPITMLKIAEFVASQGTKTIYTSGATSPATSPETATGTSATAPAGTSTLEKEAVKTQEPGHKTPEKP